MSLSFYQLPVVLSSGQIPLNSREKEREKERTAKGDRNRERELGKFSVYGVDAEVVVYSFLLCSLTLFFDRIYIRTYVRT